MNEIRELEIRCKIQEHREAIVRLEKELWMLAHEVDNGV